MMPMMANSNQGYVAVHQEYLMNFLSITPFVLIIVGIWFLIAFASHSSIIKNATQSKSLERKENMRVYNLTENLCMSLGMKMPKLNIIESDALNAFASGINENTFTVTLTRGIMNTLNDQELEGVIAHELMHIRNRDVRLLIISIIFVGIFSFVAQVLFRSIIRGGLGRSRSKNDKSGPVILVILIAVLISYFLSIIFKFGLSRKREYMADAGAAEMTRNPLALASALEKISKNHEIEEVNDEIKQLFIANNLQKRTFSLSGLFRTHPPIEKRIDFLRRL
jgi:heat shock protein HtpX